MWLKVCIFLVLGTFLASASQAVETQLGKADPIRQKRLFSLFSIVTFKNQGCSSNNSGRNGTCYTTTECSDKGGTASGNCAAGFGVCCLFIATAASDTINENCSYIQNPSFPSVYSATTAITYTVNKCSSDVCAIRLDFETFAIDGPTATDETDGGKCVDSFVVTGTSGLTTPTICGSNAGSHIYMDIGTSSTATATLAFTFASTTSTTRTWEIKATQIPCAASYRPPSGCLQYHVGLTGRFTTFNFIESTIQSHLASQDYSICIRPEQGYCCISYSVCSDTNAWTLDNTIAAEVEVDTQCTNDYVGIEGAQQQCYPSSASVRHSRICGGIFGTHDANANPSHAVCDCSAPFSVDIKTDTAAEGATAISRGACLEYMQIECPT